MRENSNGREDSNEREDFKAMRGLKRKRGHQTNERTQTEERTSNGREDFKRKRGLQKKEKILNEFEDSNGREDFKRMRGLRRKRGHQTKGRSQTEERTSNGREDFKRKRRLQKNERTSNERGVFRRRKASNEREIYLPSVLEVVKGHQGVVRGRHRSSGPRVGVVRGRLQIACQPVKKRKRPRTEAWLTRENLQKKKSVQKEMRLLEKVKSLEGDRPTWKEISLYKKLEQFWFTFTFLHSTAPQSDID